MATFLYENEAPGLEQVAVVTMATRVLRLLKRAFLCIPLGWEKLRPILECFFKDENEKEPLNLGGHGL